MNLSDKDLAAAINQAAGFQVITHDQARTIRDDAPWRLGQKGQTNPIVLAAYLKNKLDKNEIIRPDAQTRAARELDRVSKSNDIERIFGKMPEVEDPKRKKACSKDLVKFLKTYFPNTYKLDFSPFHESMLKRMQSAMIHHGTWSLETAFRGFGKTCLAEGCAMWAINYGYVKYVPIIGPDAKHAKDVSESIQTEYETNDLLYADFPEICHAVRALQGKFQRCASQSYRGKLTGIEWNSSTLVFPTIQGSSASGSIIQSQGYTGRIRGLKHKTRDGTVVRPDFAIYEDPQSDKAAKSDSKCADILDVLVNCILGLSGHTKRISVVVAATIIRSGDAIDQLKNDKERFAAWIHNNTPMIVSMPDDMDLWLGDYATIRRNFDPENKGDQARAHEASNEFYKKHRKQMDKGARAAWNEAFDETEVSAIQHGMNALIDKGQEYFDAECQGDPKQANQGIFELDESVVAKRVNGLPRLTIPATCQVVTSFIDVGHQALHWVVIGWEADFTGHVAAYGEWPGEGKQLWNPKWQSLSQGISQGLTDCVNNILSLQIKRDDGEVMPIDRMMVDCGDPATRPEVFSICRGRQYSTPVLPSRGRAHHQFRMPSDKKKRAFVNSYMDIWKSQGRVIIHDACVWRERIQKGFMSPPGTPGSIRIWGGKKERHTGLAAHICGEKLVEKLVGETGEVYKWFTVPGKGNHWLDCCVGSAVAAGIEGVRFQQRAGQAPASGRKRRRGGFKSLG